MKEFVADPLVPALEDKRFVVPASGKEVREQRLVTVVPECVYLLTQAFTGSKGGTFRAGEILSRNLELAVRNGETEGLPHFQRYRNAWDALRGFSYIPKGYERRELPSLAQWNGSVDFLIALALDAGSREELGDEVVDSIALGIAEEHALDRDPDKVEAREQTARMTLTDSAGRSNPGRLSWMRPLVAHALERRRRTAEALELRMDARSIAFAQFVESHLVVYQMLLNAVELLLKNPLVFGGDASRTDMLKKALEIKAHAQELRIMRMRPFGPWSMKHISDDLEETAAFLMEGSPARAAVTLDLVRRSISLVFLRSRLECISAALSHAKHLKRDLSPVAWERLGCVLEQFLGDVRDRKLEHGFRNPVLVDVRESLNTAHRCVKRFHGKERLEEVSFALKAACKPI